MRKKRIWSFQLIQSGAKSTADQKHCYKPTFPSTKKWANKSLSLTHSTKKITGANKKKLVVKEWNTIPAIIMEEENKKRNRKI